jgi:type I restriction enzyme R subunit
LGALAGATMSELQFFDPQQEYAVVWRRLPHWAQVGTVCFLTWRVGDSLPSAVQDEITAERQRVLRDNGLDARKDWKQSLSELPAPVRGRVQWALFVLWDRYLDAGRGQCVLRRPELSALVAHSLMHFDGDRYVVTDFVVMPNHVHLLVAFRDEESLLKQCTSWKRFTARQIHRRLGDSGEFWQADQFDHLVRSLEQFDHYRRYIAENPRRAGLCVGAYRWYSKPL